MLGLQVGSIQPAKLAAFELALHTEPGPAPMRLGGVLDRRRSAVGVDDSADRLDSLPAARSTRPFPGLDTVPRSDWPPVNITHWSFQLMVGIGMLLALAVVLFWLARRRGRDLLGNRWFCGSASLPGHWRYRAGIGLDRHRGRAAAVDGVAGAAHH